MQARLLAWTQQNPALSPDSVAGFSDLAALWQGNGSFAENVVEYAGRVCYRSTHRMGTAPDFIAARVREGHEDVVEHIWATVEFSGDDDPLRWRMVNRHCEVSEVGPQRWIVSGNLRVWLHFFHEGLATEARPLIVPIAPAVFADLGENQAGAPVSDTSPARQIALDSGQTALDSGQLVPVQDGQMRVTLLGYTQPLLGNAQSPLSYAQAPLGDAGLLQHHGAATFLFEGISRTCTHQLVRHRLASFSQESQRYVDLSKGGWNPIVPTTFRENPQAMQVLDEFWALAEEKYDELRRLGIRKEDARFLLPNAAETRIVTSMNFAAWSHFFWLRAVDKAAQWEIRAMGQHALRMLHAIAPDVFAEHWNAYLEMGG